MRSVFHFLYINSINHRYSEIVDLQFIENRMRDCIHWKMIQWILVRNISDELRQQWQIPVVQLNDGNRESKVLINMFENLGKFYQFLKGLIFRLNISHIDDSQTFSAALKKCLSKNLDSVGHKSHRNWETDTVQPTFERNSGKFRTK